MAALVRHAGSALGQASGKLLDKQEVVSSSLLPPLQAFVAVLPSVGPGEHFDQKAEQGCQMGTVLLEPFATREYFSC